MEIEEVIKWLEFDMDLMTLDYQTADRIDPESLKCRSEQEYNVYKALESAVKTLKKQIPERTVDRVRFYECPTCESDRIKYFDCYCRVCGQKLEW